MISQDPKLYLSFRKTRKGELADLGLFQSRKDRMTTPSDFSLNKAQGVPGTAKGRDLET